MPKKQITIPIFIPNLGCAHRCFFCNQKHTSGSKIIPDETYIKNKVEQYLADKQSSVENIEIAFFGGSFTGIPIKKQEELLSCASIFLSEKKINRIRLSTRPDYIDNEKLSLLKKYNVSTIELGVQSFYDEVLTASNRGHTVKNIFAAIELINSFDFDCVIQLMPGLPGDTNEKSISSAEIAAGLKPSAVRIYPTVVLKDTELANMYIKKKYNPLLMDDAIEVCKSMYQIFRKHQIPVIRIGLHPLSPGEVKNIIAGPYHPAFGFLVKSRINRDLMEKQVSGLIKDNNSVKYIKFNIPETGKEEFIGNKKENIVYIKKKFNLEKIEYSIGKSESLSTSSL